MKNQKILAVLFLAFIVASCAVPPRYIRKDSVAFAGFKPGSVFYVGSLLVDPALSWTENRGNYQYSYQVPFKSPELPMAAFFGVLSPELQKIIGYRVLDAGESYQFFRAYRQANIQSYSYLPNSIPVFDALKKKGLEAFPMDPNCLKFLRIHAPSDYYLVTFGEIASYQMPSQTGRKKLSLTPLWTMVIYDQDGNKVFQKSYSRTYNKIELSHTKVGTYYFYLMQDITDHEKEINEDLSMLKDCPAAGQTIENYLALRREEFTNDEPSRGEDFKKGRESE